MYCTKYAPPPPNISSAHLAPDRVVTVSAFENPVVVHCLLHPGPQLPGDECPEGNLPTYHGGSGCRGQKAHTSRIKYVLGV